MGNYEKETCWVVVKEILGEVYYDNVFHDKEKAYQLKEILERKAHKYFKVKVVELEFFS